MYEVYLSLPTSDHWQRYEYVPHAKYMYLDTPASPHVIVSANRVALAHETKVHSRPNQLPVEG